MRGWRSGWRSGAVMKQVLAALMLLAVGHVSTQDYEQQQSGFQQEAISRCYNETTGQPQRCVPPFENAAYQVQVEATNTCGEDRPSEYCVQAGASHGSSTRRSCNITCYRGMFSPSYLTDVHQDDQETWWQSDTMLAGIPQVNLTLHLGKAFDITYVRLVFHSPRPQSFAIYKRSSENSSWTPYQFYSATCRDSYGLPESQHAPRGEETRALCTSEYSDISPLTKGNIVFSTLEGRPSNYYFEQTPELQEWVTATDLRITLDRMNTFGDEYFGDPQVLSSYFFAISDFAVGARCKCNGHASECKAVDNGSRRECKCQHNTDGPDCNRCLPFYNDAPWGRATSHDAHECRACNCNGFASRCYFDKDLYEATGHGGHCLDCLGNRAGPNCERCKDNFYAREDGVCIDCQCNEQGSRSLQCNTKGQCQCKPGVTGDKCDRCEANHYDFGTHGCTPCNCNEAGSIDNAPNCDTYTGACYCKENVEGKRCGVCKPGFFSLNSENEFGCTPCFCYGHSSICQSATGYAKVTTESVFARNNEKWSAEDTYGRSVPLRFDSIIQTIGLSAPSQEPVYFLAPDKFLGDQRTSYNQDLSFKLRIGENGPIPTVQDVVLEGAGLSISQAIFGQNNNPPTVKEQEYVFRLHEHKDYGWQPRLTARDFLSLLSNLTAIKIRGTYIPEGVGFLDDVKLRGARRGAAGQPAEWIEMCSCPEGYVGQFCESCAPGYRHEPPHGGPFAQCVPCNCHGHSEDCDADTGRCICQHNTAGDNCDRCAKGFYGNALQQTPDDCKACPCPDGGACMQLPDETETVVCLECPKGYAGPKCDLCSDGYYGDPTGRFGPIKLCQPCDCNDNVDPNAVGNCNRTTGECLKCIYNTGGFECEQCLPGFYGDPLSQTKGDCKPCQCSPYGTNETDDGLLSCNQFTGQCQCKPHVIGTNCDTCEAGYFNITSGEGCQACDCDRIGSVNHTCNVDTGKCNCREGITGRYCDRCLPYHYGFSTDGCRPCDCDGIGSTNLECDPSGQCPCHDNVEGRRCDRCKENKYDRQNGCLDCPPCYNLVRDAVKAHRNKLNELQQTLKDIANNPTATDDADFERQLAEVQRNVNKLHEDAKINAGSEDKGLLQRIEELKQQLETVSTSTNQVKKWTKQAAAATELGVKNVTMAEKTIERIQSNLRDATEYLQTDGQAALQKAQDRSNEFGQRSAQMTNIAKEARARAQQQEEEVQKIKKIAEEAKNVSSRAFSLADSALKQQQNTSSELRKLGGDIVQLGQKLEDIKEIAMVTSARVNATHEDALGVGRDIFALEIPDINVPKIKEDANIARGEAERMKNEALEVVESRKELLKDLNKQMQQSEELLSAGEQQRQKATDLLAQVDDAYAKASKAVIDGDKILQEAQDTYATLQKFDKQVQESKSQAPDALARKPKIEQLIAEARSKTDDARQALVGAQTNSQRARDSAQDAQLKYAEVASNEADNIRKEAGETKEKAGKLRDEADLLAGRVISTASRVSELEAQAERDEDLTSSAKQNVGQAKSDVSESAKKVQKALEDVEAIIKELHDFSDSDGETQDLNKLEERLAAAQEEFERADLDKRIEKLSMEKQVQVQWMKSYQEDVDRLTAEVNNIQDIRNALPLNCFNDLVLEPAP